LIYDITNSKTFDALSRWLEDIKEFGPEDINIIIVGNKFDLNYRREVSYQDASMLAEKYNIKYVEVSALTGKNVPDIFEILTNIMIKQDIARDNSRIKIKGKIDKSHVTANHNITLDRSVDPNSRNNSDSKCC